MINRWDVEIKPKDSEFSGAYICYSLEDAQAKYDELCKECLPDTKVELFAVEEIQTLISTNQVTP